ncbi:MAG: hypothetical protein RR513_06520 [Muribaculaceae bacterium]
MKTVEEVLKHLKNVVYTKDALSKIDGFLEGYKLFNNEEPCMYGTHAPTIEGKSFGCFMGWFNGTDIKDGDWIQFTIDNSDRITIVEGSNLVCAENKDGFIIYKTLDITTKYKKLIEEYSIYKVLNKNEVECLILKIENIKYNKLDNKFYKLKYGDLVIVWNNNRPYAAIMKKYDVFFDNYLYNNVIPYTIEDYLKITENEEK